MSKKSTVELKVPMAVDVDGAPNAYGPKSRDKETLDFEANAHERADVNRPIVGYLTKNDDGRTPIVQSGGSGDPFPGLYISATGYADKGNPRLTDPRRYVNGAEINYTLWATKARQAGVKRGDFCVVHSLRTRHSAYAIVGDTGNSAGDEGSLALLQRLGYAVKDGRAGGEDFAKIVVRYFADTNPEQRFFFHQADLEAIARGLDLDTNFSDFHADGDPGTLVFDQVAHDAADLRVERSAPFVPLAKNQAAPPYPKRVIKRDSDATEAVKLIQHRLFGLGYTETFEGKVRPLTADGEFGRATTEAVELFQIRHTDNQGRPLTVDGEVGAASWGALFGAETVPQSPDRVRDKLSAEVIAVAGEEVGVMEEPPGSNRGKKVQQYQKLVGIDPGEPWCAAFVYYCFATAAGRLKRKNPMETSDCKSGQVLDLWNRARRASRVKTISPDEAADDPSRVKPGMVFIISTSGEHGHTGLVAGVHGNRLETIEGNTNDGGSREGIGVFRRTGRTLASINRGFIDFSAA